MVYRGYRARRETAQLGNRNKITAEAQSQNCESGGQKRTAHGTSMETCRCSTMGAIVSRGRGVLEDRRSHPRSRIRIGPQFDTRTCHSSELSPAAIVSFGSTPFQLPPFSSCAFLHNIHSALERVCCLLVLNLVSSTLPCIRQPGPRLRVHGVL